MEEKNNIKEIIVQDYKNFREGLMKILFLVIGIYYLLHADTIKISFTFIKDT